MNTKTLKSRAEKIDQLVHEINLKAAGKQNALHYADNPVFLFHT